MHRAGGTRADAGLDRTPIPPFLAAAVPGARDGGRLAAKVPAAHLRRTCGAVPPKVAAGMAVTAVW